jgi:putative DNA primase/helicase
MGDMRAARREDMFTKVAACSPRELPTPIFDSFLSDAMGGGLPPGVCECAACQASELIQSPEERQKLHLAEVGALVDYMHRLLGYGLSGDVSEQILVLQYGLGGNGKGLLADFLEQCILGREPSGYATEIPAEALISQRNDRHPTELMVLLGARLAFSREVPEGRWNEDRVKRLSGGDPIQARKMRQDFITFLPTHLLICFGNNKPILYGSAQMAWKRRLHFIPFRQIFGPVADPAKNILLADPRLLDKLRPEAPGVFWKLIQAGIDRLKNGLRPPATVTDAATEYLIEQNQIAAWIADACELSNDPSVKTTVNALWASYIIWCTGLLPSVWPNAMRKMPPTRSMLL